jgi:hypothetical protein
MEINYGTSTQTFEVDMESLQGTLNPNYDSANCPLDSVEVLNADCSDNSHHGMDPDIVTATVAGGVVTFSMHTTTRDNIDYNVCIKAKKGIQYFVKTQSIRLNKCIGVLSDNESPPDLVKDFVDSVESTIIMDMGKLD